jgi:DNA-binding response OmpR family regulator
MSETYSRHVSESERSGHVVRKAFSPQELQDRVEALLRSQPGE